MWPFTKKQKKPDTVIVSFTEEETRRIAQLMDVYGKAPDGQDYEASFDLWYYIKSIRKHEWPSHSVHAHINTHNKTRYTVVLEAV